MCTSMCVYACVCTCACAYVHVCVCVSIYTDAVCMHKIQDYILIAGIMACQCFSFVLVTASKSSSSSKKSGSVAKSSKNQLTLTDMFSSK